MTVFVNGVSDYFLRDFAAGELTTRFTGDVLDMSGTDIQDLSDLIFTGGANLEDGGANLLTINTDGLVIDPISANGNILTVRNLATAAIFTVNTLTPLITVGADVQLSGNDLLGAVLLQGVQGTASDLEIEPGLQNSTASDIIFKTPDEQVAAVYIERLRINSGLTPTIEISNADLDLNQNDIADVLTLNFGAANATLGSDGSNRLTLDKNLVLTGATATIYGGDATGEQLNLYPNTVDTDEFIRILGNSGITVFLATGGSSTFKVTNTDTPADIFFQVSEATGDVSVLNGLSCDDFAATSVAADTGEFLTSLVIGGGVLDASAVMQIDSTTQGFLPPRMTTVEMAAIVTPATGLMVYDTTTNNWKGYNGTAWVVLG